MEIIKFIYYAIGVPIVMLNIGQLLELKQTCKRQIRLRELEKLGAQSTPEYKELAKILRVPAVLHLVWCIIGLFTFNFGYYLGYILLIFMVINPLYKPARGKNIRYYTINALDRLFTIMFVVFVVLNAYHYRILPFEIWNFFFGSN
jgi:hypothetical protein